MFHAKLFQDPYVHLVPYNLLLRTNLDEYLISPHKKRYSRFLPLLNVHLQTKIKNDQSIPSPVITDQRVLKVDWLKKLWTTT